MAELEEFRAQAEVEEQNIEQTTLEVEKVFKELQKAILDSDIETLERLYADDYILTTRKGNTVTKAVRIGSLRSGEIDYLESQAVITGQMVGKVKRQSREIDQPPRRFTCVFAKHKGHWQMLAIHISGIE
jgi:ketosteroid isomerase-like protein